MNSPEFKKAFLDEQRRAQISYSVLASVLSMILMPLGSVMDWFVLDHPQFWLFFKLRLASSFFVGAAWLWFTLTGKKYYRVFGVMWYLFPTIFILWMIYAAKDPNSPYYAGLNLVQLALGLLSPWTFRQNLVSATLVILLYLGVSFLKHNKPTPVAIFNNMFFLVSTGSIVVAGSRNSYQLRFREFQLRWELDKQYKQLQDAEAQLVQTEKLASLGRLSAGIIHEINNPLNYTKTALYTLKNKAKYISPEQQAEYTDIIKDVEDGFNRVTNIVSSLRGFTHHDGESRDDVPVAELVDETLRFVSHEWRDAVKLEKNLAPDQTVAANKNKLMQVCLNLIENSLDAVKSKTYVSGESPVISITSRVENGKNLLVFRDNGPGIQPEHLDKIFDPFFTTKDVGEGMGLGLSISYRIVQEFGGEIRVASEPGKFCEFTLEFPAKG